MAIKVTTLKQLLEDVPQEVVEQWLREAVAQTNIQITNYHDWIRNPDEPFEWQCTACFDRVTAIQPPLTGCLWVKSRPPVQPLKFELRPSIKFKKPEGGE